MQVIQTSSYPIIFKEEAYTHLNQIIRDRDYSMIALLVDENTHEKCAPAFLSKLEFEQKLEIIEISPGEEMKNLETVNSLWELMTDFGMDRKSLLINLGGGVITDMGGFAASTFKRGIEFINIPTTLLAMVDASVGGKTGIDLGVLKNQIGLFADPEMVLIDPEFLNTLEKRELTSGLAEVIKYGLTFDPGIWADFKNPQGVDLLKLIYQSIAIKNDVVQKDPKEQDVRKALNYGHTLGHAIESFYLSSPLHSKMTHGEAIAIGMIAEAHLSFQMGYLQEEEILEIKQVILNVFDHQSISTSDTPAIYEFLKHDKKNVGGNVNFVLLSQIGDFILNQRVSEAQMSEALNFYNLN